MLARASVQTVPFRQSYRLANKFAPTGAASALGTRQFAEAHEQSEAAIAVGLTLRHRGLAVLVRSYRVLCLPGLITEAVGASLLAKAFVLQGPRQPWVRGNLQELTSKARQR